MIEQPKKGWIFVCTDSTERECLENMLFGDQDSEVYRRRIESVSEGDVAFLYNIDKEMIYGVFTIVEKGRNLEPYKWSGRFPLQVRVRLRTQYMLSCKISKRELQQIVGREYFLKELGSRKINELMIRLTTETAPQPIEALRRRYPEGFYKTEDGHLVRSKVEREIDNFLFSKGILHVYDKLIPGEKEFYCDFYLPDYDLYIEYWGGEGEEHYEQRKREKLAQYKRRGLKLFEIHKEDDQRLPDVLQKLLEMLSEEQ